MVSSKAWFVCRAEGSELTLNTEVSIRGQMWCLLSLMPTLQRWEQGGQEFEVSLCYKKGKKVPSILGNSGEYSTAEPYLSNYY